MSVASSPIPIAPSAKRSTAFQWNRRRTTLLSIGLCLLFFILVMLGSRLIGDGGLSTNLESRNQAPTLAHPFGTDWLGRDMLTRTLHGLSLSLWVGTVAAGISAIIGTILGLASAVFGGKVDLVITWLIDLFYSLPHLILLILIAFAVGGGVTGVVVGVAATHWTGLARIIRAEVLQLQNSPYIELSGRFGKSRWWIARHHMIPHLIPQFLVGLILLFPHAILHEAAISFIGIGLAPHTPAIGIILSESMRHLSTGYWWLGVLPGVALLVAVKAFDIMGENLRILLNPKTSQE
jgi:peptide/nickel transport system permease protein